MTNYRMVKKLYEWRPIATRLAGPKIKWGKRYKRRFQDYENK